jgi:hypothetical protein
MYRCVWAVLDSGWWTEKLPETCRVLFQNKFEKLVHLVGFIIRIYHDARSHECQQLFKSLGIPLVGNFTCPTSNGGCDCDPRKLDTHVLNRFSRNEAAVNVKLTLPTAGMNNAWRCTSTPALSFLAWCLIKQRELVRFISRLTVLSHIHFFIWSVGEDSRSSYFS